MRQKNANDYAMEAAKRLDIPLIASSDAHMTGINGLWDFEQLGHSYTKVSKMLFVTPTDFVEYFRECLYEKKHEPVCETVPVKYWWNWFVGNALDKEFISWALQKHILKKKVKLQDGKKWKFDD